MGQKDTLTKEYISHNDIFADIFNYALHQGAPVIHPQQLVEKNITEIALPMGKDGKMFPVQRYRDILKALVIKETGDTIYAILGIENQSIIHYAMPVKNLLYDMLNYASQVSARSAEYKKERKEQKNNGISGTKEGSSSEFLSGFHKEDKLKPVITVTVYFGTDEWDAPRNLREMFDTENPYAQRFVPDYPLFLIHPNEISDFGQFQSEFGSLMQILSTSGDRERMNKLLYGMQDNDTMISRNAIEILRKFTGLSVKVKKKEEVVEMGRLCKALEDQRKIDLEEGRKSGLKEGQKAMEKERKNIASQMKNEGFSIALIAKILQLSEGSVNQLLS